MIRGFKLEGYLSHKDTTITGIPKGIIQILGDNGSGKSSLVESALYAMYGKTRNDVSKAVMDVGQVAVKYGDYTFRRGKTTSISLKDKVVAKGSAQVKKYVEDLIGVDPFLFFQASYFGNGISDQIVSSAPTKRLELLQCLLPALGVYQKAESLASSKAADWVEKETKYESIIAYAKDQTGDFDVEAAKKKLASWEMAKESISKDLSDLNLKANGVERTLIKYNKLHVMNEQYRKQLKEMPPDVRVDEEKCQKRITELETDLVMYDACINHSHKGPSCPFCGSTISEKTMQGIQMIYAKKKMEHVRMTERHAELLREKKTYLSAEKLLSNLKSQLEEYSSIEDFAKAIKTLEAQLKRSDDDANKMSKRLEDVVKDMAVLKSKISNHKRQTGDIGALKKKLKDVRLEVSEYRDVQFMFSKRGIPYELLKGLVAILERRATTIYNTITSHQAQIRIEFVTISNQAGVEYNLVKSGGKVVSFSTLSTGQKTLYVFAVRLALSELLTAKMDFKPSFLVLDEVTSNLSTEVRERFANYLRQLTQRYEQIFVTSHTSLPAVQDFTIQCVLEGEVSHVTKG